MKDFTMRVGLSCAALLAAAACTEESGGGGIVALPDIPDELRESTPPVVADVRPPPLAGGTLLVTRAGIAVAADPDRDRIVLVQLPAGQPREIVLTQGDEPGRSVEDGLGHVHVALRRGGALVTIDPVSGAVLARRQVCGAPRGVAHDPATDLVYVACAGGELVSLSASDLAAPVVASQNLQPDLRDVVVAGDHLLISTLRGAKVITIGPAGAAPEMLRPAHSTADDFDGSPVDYAPSVGWRMISAGPEAALMVHTMAQTTPIEMGDRDDMSPAYMGGGGILRLVRPELSRITAAGIESQIRLLGLDFSSMPIDVAHSPSTDHLAVLDAAIGVVEYDTTAATAFVGGNFLEGASAITYTPDGLLVVQSREPAMLSLLDGGIIISTIELGGASRADTGFDLFHGLGSAMSPTGLACASCHPEGRDDGHVWRFSDIGDRRTQSLAGTVAGTAPFHWEGDLESFAALVDEVMMRRMGAMPQSMERIDVLRTWVESVPPVHAGQAIATDAGDVERGRAIFESNETLCASCHGGPALTNNTSAYVGTGIAVQVPSLVGLGTRAPYMHDGCAPTLFDRFKPECGGGDMHGFTSQLSEADIRDLVAYMLTL